VARAWLGAALVGFAAGAVVSLVATYLAEAAVGWRPSSHLAVPVSVTIADVAGLWVGLLGAVLWASRTKGTARLARDFGLRLRAWWDLPLGIAVGLACQFGLIPLLYLPFERADPHLARRLARPAHEEVGSAHGPVAAAVILLALAVGAPLVEELFFRGLILQALTKLLPVPLAVVLDGALFGLAHFEPLQLAGLVLLGVVLAAMTLRLGRLAPAIAAHAAFNAAAVLAVLHLR